jgi:hypothetical protein
MSTPTRINAEAIILSHAGHGGGPPAAAADEIQQCTPALGVTARGNAP